MQELCGSTSRLHLSQYISDEYVRAGKLALLYGHRSLSAPLCHPTTTVCHPITIVCHPTTTVSPYRQGRIICDLLVENTIIQLQLIRIRVMNVHVFGN